MSNKRERLFVGDNNLDALQKMWEETDTPKGASATLSTLIEWALPKLIGELKRCYERIDYLESIAEEYRQERPEEYCANCYAYIEEYDGDGVKECLCSDCKASE